MTTELKPCPFCGGEANFHTADEGGKYVMCVQCRASSHLCFPLMDNVEQKLAEAWNRRILSTDIQHLVYQPEQVTREWPRANGQPFPVDGWILNPEFLSRIVNNIDVQPCGNEWQVSMEQVEDVLLATERLGIITHSNETCDSDNGLIGALKSICKITYEAGFNIGGPLEHCPGDIGEDEAKRLLNLADQYLKDISKEARSALATQGEKNEAKG